MVETTNVDSDSLEVEEVKLEEVPFESDTEEKQAKQDAGTREALRAIFAWENYSTYILTAWAFSSFVVLSSFLSLYLRSIGWEFITIGLVLTLVSVLAAVSRLVGGYLGDVVDRKHLAVLAIGMAACYHIMLGFFVDFVFVFSSLMIIATLEVFKGGSSAYIMDNISKEHSGLALSLFSAGRSFGILVLVAMGLLTPLIGFNQTIRALYLSAGILLIFCTIVRNRYLSSSIPTIQHSATSLWTKFWQENRRAGKLLLTIMPGVLAVIILDSISDALFSFGAFVYTNEFLGISYNGIITIQIVSLLISGPVLLLMGRTSDKQGTKKTSLFIYSLMPICVLIFILAPQYPLWVSEGVYLSAETMMTGLGVFFTTPFIGFVLKTLNDILWGLMLLTLVQKRLPRKDTSKLLAIFWFIIYITSSLAPLVGGAIFQFMDAQILFYLVLALNFMIIGAIARLGTEKISMQD